MADADLSEFEELNKPRRLHCTIGLALEQLDKTDAHKLQAALAVQRYSHSTIAKWLAQRGLSIRGHTVGRHRRGDCSCHA